MNSDIQVVGPRQTWGEDDWDEYRGLSLISRRLADLVELMPRMARWLLPLIAAHEGRVRRRRYERLRRSAAKELVSATQRSVAQSRTPGSRNRYPHERKRAWG